MALYKNLPVLLFVLFMCACSSNPSGGEHPTPQPDVGVDADRSDVGVDADSGPSKDAADEPDSEDVDAPPTISTVADQSIDEDTSTGALSFTIDDDRTRADDLIVSANSSDTMLVPDANITFGGSGADRTIEITPAINEAGTATITLAVDDGGQTVETRFDVTVVEVNDLPVISSVATQTIDEDETTGELAFTVRDLETSSDSLVVSATSSDTELIPDANITLGGSGTDRTIEITPAIDEAGTATITLAVDDGTDIVETQFDVIVTPLNDAPTISAIADQTIDEDTGTGELSFSVGDAETAPDALAVTATSNNPTLVPDANITLGGAGTARSIELTPAAEEYGTVTITVTIDDGTATSQTQFDVIVSRVFDPPTIGSIADQTTDEDTSIDGIQFEVRDPDTYLWSVDVTASSSNPAVIPDANLNAYQNGGTGTLSITPASNQHGTSTITVSVTDGTSTVSTSFEVVVLPVDDPPVVTGLNNRIVDPGETIGQFTFGIDDVDTPTANLSVSASSLNPGVIPDSDVVLGGSGANRTIDINAAPPQGGYIIEIAVFDGNSLATTNLSVGVSPEVTFEAGHFHSCALESDGSVMCWGTDATPPSGTDFIDVGVGSSHSCVLRSSGSIECWGTNYDGQATPPTTSDFVSVRGGQHHTCGLRNDGSITCWGENSLGEATSPAGSNFVQLSTGAQHNCAIKTDGSIDCWGHNPNGNRSPPAGHDFVQVGVGSYQSCALREDASVICWGGSYPAPQDDDFLQIGVGGAHICGLKVDGSIKCWGYNGKGQATPPAGNDFVEVTGGEDCSCARKSNGTIECWGWDQWGQASPP